MVGKSISAFTVLISKGEGFDLGLQREKKRGFVANRGLC